MFYQDIRHAIIKSPIFFTYFMTFLFIKALKSILTQRDTTFSYIIFYKVIWKIIWLSDIFNVWKFYKTQWLTWLLFSLFGFFQKD